jgi:hypothetical protein
MRASCPSARRLGPLAPYRVLADDEIDLDFHLRVHVLPAPGDERELGLLVSRLHSQELDLTRPAWGCTTR